MSNSIVTENALPGNPSTEWDLSGPGATNIQGFATDISVNRSQTVYFKISTDSNNYRIDIYRMGYYGGLGGRKVASSVPAAGLSTVTILRMPSAQPGPFTNSSIGLVDAGNWSVSASWAVPSTAVSGVYIAHLVRQDATSGENHIPFIVRDDGVPHDIVFQTSDTTWHAYNGWGGYSLYGGGATASSDGRAYKVSYNRPIATRDGVGTYAGPQDFLFGVEIAAIHWLEANGYDVCYIAGVDTDRLDTTGNGGQLLNHKVFLSVGHDEYWSGSSPANSNGSLSLSKGQRANVEAARAAGVNLAFWSGNEVFWKTRYESSTVTTDGSPTAYRTLVCYKETRDDKVLDPDDPPTCTCTWRDPRFSPPGDAGRPENALTGTIFMVDDFREDQILIPYPMTTLRFWRNTAVATTAPGNSGSLVKNYLGYEWDSSPDNGFRPAGLIPLSSTTVSVNTLLLDYGHTEGPGVATHNLTLYRDPAKGALVFGAGTVMWSWGLDGDHDPDPKDPTPTPTDPNVKQAMVNLLFDMGVSAGSLQSGLVPPTQSTDTTPPSSTITFPANGASLPQNQTVTISGTSSDAGGHVGVVEVSTDGGTTWHPALGTTSWSYNWTPPAAGPATIQARGVDDSFNFESPGPSISVTVAAATGISLFSGNNAPAVVTVNDPNPVELGVKFQSSQAGSIAAIRFYKGPSNTGTHVGHLWTASGGTPLATATFSNETSSGWQQINLSSPVPITANTIYVVSYHTSSGEYSGDDHYFDTAAQTNGPLTAPATGNVAGGNGVYAYGSNSSFPTNTYLGSNYWVDVVFKPASSQTWSISGTISPASLGAGTTVGLSGAATATVTADSSGNYSFSGLANGTYTVTPTRSGSTFNPASQSVTINGANVTAVNFTAASSQTWSISGTISPASLGAGTTVGLSGAATATVTADSSGNYSFSGLVNGTYTVTPSRSGLTFNPTSQSVTVNGTNVTAVNFTAQGTPTGIAIDATVSRDQSGATITTPAFSTTSGNELLLAFVATDYLSGTNTTVTGVSGGGLTWALVRRTNVQSGTAEIWRAFAPAALSNVTVTATLSHNVSSTLTVMSFKGVDATGTNGSGAIGATGSGNSLRGAPTASLVTTRNGSWVVGVGNDYDNATSRTPGAGQVLVHQYLAPVGDTYWVQRQNTATAASGTTVSINDTAPTTDRYNLTICEVLPHL
jgi:Domain of unknown function (DUF4082)/Bacterial Ig domain